MLSIIWQAVDGFLSKRIHPHMEVSLLSIGFIADSNNCYTLLRQVRLRLGRTKENKLFFCSPLALH